MKFKDQFSITHGDLVRASLLILTLATTATVAAPPGDNRQLVEMPPPMQAHMLANMREHMLALNEIMTALAADAGDKAAGIAEQKLGMSSMAAHGADHMAPYMPEGMRKAGEAMHRAASRFARTAQEGDRLRAYDALGEVTAACVACHGGYRIR